MYDALFHIKALFVLGSMFLFASEAYAQAELCGDPPSDPKVSITEEVITELEGEANILSRLVGSGELAGEYTSRKKTLFQNFDNVDQSLIDRYLAFTICNIIVNDETTSTETKIDKIIEFRRAVAESRKRKDDVSTGIDRGAFLSKVRQILDRESPGNQLFDQIDAISRLKAMVNEDRSNDSLQQAKEILTKYIKKNISNRKIESEDISFDPRGAGVFQPRDIILAFETLADIRDFSDGEIRIQLIDIDFSRINFAVSYGIDMRFFELNYSNFNHAFLSGCRCSNANFGFARLTNVAVWNADFSNAIFDRATLAGSKWANVEFDGSNIETANDPGNIRLLDGPKGLRPDQQNVLP